MAAALTKTEQAELEAIVRQQAGPTLHEALAEIGIKHSAAASAMTPGHRWLFSVETGKHIATVDCEQGWAFVHAAQAAA